MSLQTVVQPATSLSGADWEKNFNQSWTKTQVDMDFWLVAPDWGSGAPGADVTFLEVGFVDSNTTPTNQVYGSLYLNAHGLSVEAAGDGGLPVVSSTTALSDGHWHHLTLVADPASGGSVSVSVDGVPSQSVAYNPRASNGSQSIAVYVGPAAYHTSQARTPLYDFHIDNLTVDFL
jgi:hypothetical protein